MKYLLDGYNILFRERDWEGSLQEQRSQLFEKLNFLADGSSFDFTVVLDAHQQVGELERHHYHSLEVIYTDFDQTADDYIIEYVEYLPLNIRCQTKVVSSDKSLMQKVRFERVEVLSVSDFFKEIEKKSRSRVSKKTESYRQIVPSKAKKNSLPLLCDNPSWIALFESRLKNIKNGGQACNHDI